MSESVGAGDPSRDAFTSERYAEWVRLSFAVGTDIDLVIFVQGLGRIDARLAAEERAIGNMPTTIEASTLVQERYTVSMLWVFGAYEVTRTIDQRIGVGQMSVPPVVAEVVKDTKRAFERVRMPLAKREKAKHFPDDDRLAFPVVSKSGFIAWAVTASGAVTREDLSSAFRRMLATMRANDPAFPNG